MKEKNKTCVTFWIDKETLKQFDKKYHAKSLFIRECIKKAIKDNNFYIDVTTKNND